MFLFILVLKPNPSNWLGENGKGVIIGPEEENLKKEKFELNKFNLLASDRIALNRTLQDVRLKGLELISFTKIQKFFIEL